MTQQQAIRILVADAQILFRKALAALVATDRDCVVVGEAADGLAAVEQAPQVRPDLILMDSAMPGMDGREATRRIKSMLPAVRIVLWGSAVDQQSIDAAFRSGADEYLHKEVDTQTFFATVKRVARGAAGGDGGPA